MLPDFIDGGRFEDARGDGAALGFGGFDDGFDDFAVFFAGESACAAGAARTGGTTNSVEVDVVGLGRFVVNYCGDVFDVKTAGGEICGEEKIDRGGTEEFDGFYSLLGGG